MENVIKNCDAQDKNCIGSQKFNKDIMVTMVIEGSPADFHDYFLTTEQAEHLVKRLTSALESNKEG